MEKLPKKTLCYAKFLVGKNVEEFFKFVNPLTKI